MYRLTDHADVIVRIEDGVHIPRGHRFWAEYEAWLAEDNAPQPKESLEPLRQRLLFSLDASADAASQVYAGKELRALEYQRAAAEALAYKDAGYRGEAPPAVWSWAEAKGFSGREAADGILARAAAGEQALRAIRDLRLKGKEAVRNAADAAAAQAAAKTAIEQLRNLAAPPAPAEAGQPASAASSRWRAPFKRFSKRL